MRKWIVPVVLLLVVLVGVFYFVGWNKTDENPTIQAKTQVAVNAKAFARMALTPSNWPQWWPGKTNPQQALRFSFRGSDYTIVDRKYASLVVAITAGKDTVLTELVVIAAKPDTVHLFWTGAVPAAYRVSANPQPDGFVKKVDRDLKALLQAMEKHYGREENLYGRIIREEAVVDSAFISTSATLPGYPTTDNIYRMLERLKAFAQQNNAKQTGYPMLNISKTAGESYLTRVAFPVDRPVPNKEDIQYRRMPAGRNILVTEIRGGPAQIEKAYETVEQYLEDHGRIAPAIPYQALLTDRKAEPDTAKWVTKLYWPVM